MAWGPQNNITSVVLIATASIFMDRILRQDQVSERLQNQIWLWLALTLSLSGPFRGQDDAGVEEILFQSWLHGVFFANILAIFLQTHRARRNVGGSNPRIFPVASPRRGHVVDLLPFATWIAMLSAAVPLLWDSSYLNSRDAIIWTLQVFVLSLAVLRGMQWHVQRTARTAREVQAIPSTGLAVGQTSDIYGESPGSLHSMDESQWYTWNVSQTWNWISKVLEKTEDDEDVAFVLQLLALQRIRGDVLDTLNNHQLVETLHVPYGPATHLSQAIERLTRQYPRPRSAMNDTGLSFGDGAPLTDRAPDWLTLHDQEYNNWVHPRSYVKKVFDGNTDTGNQSSDQQSFQQEVPAFDPDQEERLAKLMKERYGLELPTIRTSTKQPHGSGHAAPRPEVGASNMPPLSAPKNSSAPSVDPADKTESWPLLSDVSQHVGQPLQPQDPGNNTPYTDRSDSQAAPIPPVLLAQMPPNVREIAQRRPDLVQQLLAQRQQLQQERRPAPLDGGMAPSMVIEEEGELDGNLEDDETTSLIQRRPRSKYESTNGNSS